MIPAGTGNGNGIIVWFACKICRHSFQNIDSFLEHKREMHFGEFQKLSCVVFEERDIAENWDYNLDDGSSLSPATVIKQEQLLSSEDQHSDLKPEINIALARKAEVEPDPTVCQIKNETGTFPKNPYVLLQRLTSKKIQQYNKCQTQALLPHHLTVPLESETLKCPLKNSGKTPKTRAVLLKHPKLYTPCKRFKCLRPNCGKAFKLRRNLLKHWKIHPPGKKFKCSHTNCGKSFKNREVLVLHLKGHTYGKIFKCPHPNCERAFSIRIGLTAHLVTHTEEKLYKCQEPNCGREFKRKGSLRTHLLIHSDSRPCFHCPYPSCRNVFRNKISLQKHCLSCHSQDSSAVIDKLLKKQKKCDRSDCLTSRYQRSGGGERELFKCPHRNCTKEFRRESRLRRHLPSHFRVRPYKCSVPDCGKAFKNLSTLKVHVKIIHHTRNIPSNTLRTEDNPRKCFTSLPSPTPTLIKQENIVSSGDDQGHNLDVKPTIYNVQSTQAEPTIALPSPLF